jgi:hypothetical protein
MIAFLTITASTAAFSFICTGTTQWAVGNGSGSAPYMAVYLIDLERNTFCEFPQCLGDRRSPPTFTRTLVRRGVGEIVLVERNDVRSDGFIRELEVIDLETGAHRHIYSTETRVRPGEADGFTHIVKDERIGRCVRGPSIPNAGNR